MVYTVMYMAYTVQAKGITKSFDGHRVLDAVDLNIERQSVFALLGPNGAGKTTMVRILATLERPDSGVATIAGHDLLSDPKGVKDSISLTGQFAAVDDVLTGRENLELMARLRHLPKRDVVARTRDLLASFDLIEGGDRRVSTYSGGMKRRLDLAMSMVEQPLLLFLDEPTTGLDPRSREQLWQSVRRLIEEGVTILLTTQYLEEADRLADTIAVLNRGRIVAQGTPDELKASLGTEVIRLEFADISSCARADAALIAARCDPEAHAVEVASDGTAAQVLAVLSRLAKNGIDAQRVSIHRPNLNDVFLSLTGSDLSRSEEDEVA
jgi:ABC-2 type transport system ATP-binding protein